ncbi:MAG: DUF4258 domain-containing protein [Deltaproteobacteria bacterium]|nr:DUF4258 domain-containing protein [Deltaproteobacteria bacterium]
MKIEFSRHAKRRMQLYGINQSTIIGIIEEMRVCNGHQKTIKKVAGHTFPLKIVFTVNEPDCLVITAYPLKKGLKK